VLAWLSLWNGVQSCIWPSWCYCHSLSLASVKSRLFLPFWYRLIRVVPDKGPTWSDFITWTTLKIHDCVIDWLQEGAKNSVWNWARGKEKHYSETDVTGGGWWGNVYIPIPVPPLCIRRVGTTICMFVRGARVRCVFAIQCWQPCQRGVIVIRYILLICVHARLYLCDQRRKYVVQRLNWHGRLGWRLHDVAD